MNSYPISIGLVKWFNPDKGFGVIGTPDDGDFFLHVNNLTISPEKITIGTAIAFTKEIDKFKKRNTAINSRLVGEIEDWKIIFSYLGKPDNVAIEINTVVNQRISRKKIQPFSLMKLSIKQFMRGKSPLEITNSIIDYFDNDLDSELFIPYCTIIEEEIIKIYPRDRKSVV